MCLISGCRTVPPRSRIQIHPSPPSLDKQEALADQLGSVLVAGVEVEFGWSNKLFFDRLGGGSVTKRRRVAEE